VRNASLWRALLGVENTVIEDVEFDEEAEVVVASVRPLRAGRGRCGACGVRAPWYDSGGGRRRWRGLDLGTMQVFLEADAPRVNCPIHGPTVRQVPWARHGAGHTFGFDQQVAWLATQCSKTAITELMRTAWRTVGAIITRVWGDTAGDTDLFAGLRRIGIDEISS
jgi:transposase